MHSGGGAVDHWPSYVVTSEVRLSMSAAGVKAAIPALSALVIPIPLRSILLVLCSSSRLAEHAGLSGYVRCHRPSSVLNPRSKSRGVRHSNWLAIFIAAASRRRRLNRHPSKSSQQ